MSVKEGQVKQIEQLQRSLDAERTRRYELEALLAVKQDKYGTGQVRYRGVYLDGVYTRPMALAIKEEATQVLKFFDRTAVALKKSMKQLKEKNT